MQQLRNVATLPWIKGLAVMPDVHYGKGATVGSVIAMHGAVCPAAVGVDIGCGMTRGQDLADRERPARATSPGCAPRSSRPSRSAAACTTTRSTRGTLHGWPTAGWDDFWGRFDGLAEAVQVPRGAGRQADGNARIGQPLHRVLPRRRPDSVWLMLHSGSRNIGKELAEYHIGVAQKLPHNQGLVDRDLAVFIADTPQMAAYRNDLFWAQEYAKYNRALMMALLQDVVRKEFKKAKADLRAGDLLPPQLRGRGALRGHGPAGHPQGRDPRRAPASTASSRAPWAPGSYIVKGLGNETAFNSASHGAGRRMSRNAAKRRFSTRDLEEQTRGVECRKDSGVVDEIPGAYKPIEQVIDQQRDLVEVVAKLKQVVCVKG